jgi:hypothetical protein
MRRAEQERLACKSITRARLSGETSSKEQGFGREEQASGLIIQGINRRFTGRASRARASRATSLRSRRVSFSHSPLQLGDALVEVGRGERLGETLDGRPRYGA